MEFISPLAVLYFSFASAAIALVFASIKNIWVNRQDSGSERMVEIAGHIRSGAMAFLAREYRILSVFVLAVALLLVAGYKGALCLVAVSFVVGAFCSALAGFFGMRVATTANVRTAHGARAGLGAAMGVAFSGGVVMGMCVVGLALAGLSALMIIYTHFLGGLDDIVSLKTVLRIINGFALGASSIALFARVGGGIFTKAADVGADLVGKVEAGIPEDDPRNPATIADNVGDNVGDVAGMGADLFESYVGAIIGSMVLGASATVAGEGSVRLIFLPLILAAVGILVSIAGTCIVHIKEEGNPQRALDIGTFSSAAGMAILTYVIIKAYVPDAFMSGGKIYSSTGIFRAAFGGLIAGVLIGVITEYYTAEGKNPVKRIARASETGSATNIISGLGIGMISTAAPVFVICIAIILAFSSAGLYGIAVAALGMLATTGFQLAVDAYGPIADNAGGIAEMSRLPAEARERTDRLDAVGNTTAAIGKGFAIGSAALTALALFAAYCAAVRVDQQSLCAIDITKPAVMVGLFIGAMLPFLFSSLAMGAVERAASTMIVEVRRQFREIAGLLEGTAPAEYARCIDISTVAAIKAMGAPGVIALVAPVLIGFIGGAEMLGGTLAGVTVSGVMLALFMSNAGGAWDNAKKHIENGNHGGKGSEAHKASVTGDTVGDPFKDTAGPSLNILIKLMAVVSLIIAPLLTKLN